MKEAYEKGELVSDEIVIRLIEREMKVHNNVNGFIFKGFPRTILQSYILDGLLRRMGMGVSYVVELQAPTIELIKRLDKRGRSDKARTYDLSTELIIHRLEEYDTKTAPVMELYKKQNKHVVVNAIGPNEEIFERLSETVQSAMKKSR